MLKPVTYYNGNGFRSANENEYKERIRQDKFIYNENEKKLNNQAVMNYGNQIFNNLQSIVNVNESNPDSSSDKRNVDSWLNKLSNFEVLGEQETEFYKKFKPHNGMMSLVRGYYKLLPTPDQTFNQGIENWQTDVLFNEGPDNAVIYKYKCNVGPLVNSLAVVRYLRPREFYNRVNPFDKRELLLDILNKPIYVSSSELVVYEDFNSHLKEVLWFTW